jgi:glycosyltransferase involved in cell wall biosynthesis
MRRILVEARTPGVGHRTLPTRRLTFGGMRVVIADPPAYTPPYDRSLAAALARADVDVELVTSRFRFGAVATPLRYEAREWFYPLSSRMGGSRLRLAVKAIEHPLGMARFTIVKADVIHVQWLGAPEMDRWLFRPRSPAVLTAHDIIPRRTSSKTALWKTLFERFQRVVVHSDRGRGQLIEFGLDAAKVRVIGHPVFRSDVDRRDDGRTALCLGLIRPYKGTEDAVEAVLGISGARLLVVGDPRVPLDGLQRTAGDRAEWRLGYLPEAELRRALSEATVALFPYRAEIDVSGALLQVLGAGVPAIVYDIGGLGEVVGRYRAGAVVPPGDTAAMSAALERLLGDTEALAAARAGAERARDELTWDASAAAHLDLYREIA